VVVRPVVLLWTRPPGQAQEEIVAGRSSIRDAPGVAAPRSTRAPHRIIGWGALVGNSSRLARQAGADSRSAERWP